VDAVRVLLKCVFTVTSVPAEGLLEAVTTNVRGALCKQPLPCPRAVPSPLDDAGAIHRWRGDTMPKCTHVLVNSGCMHPDLTA
jgi:hypothetical protein